MSDHQSATEALIPVTQEELEQDITILLAVMRAQKAAGWIRENPHFVKALVQKLWTAGLRPYRKPPVVGHSTPRG